MSTDIKDLKKPFSKIFTGFSRYRALLFFLFIAIVYGFIVYRINVLSSADPNQSAIAQASTGPKQPHIDQTVVQKITDLQDNSVNVQTLFNQTRQNPFQE